MKLTVETLESRIKMMRWECQFRHIYTGVETVPFDAVQAIASKENVEIGIYTDGSKWKVVIAMPNMHSTFTIHGVTEIPY